MATGETSQPAESEAINDWFQEFAHRSALSMGNAWAFLAAILIIVVWAASGVFFRYSDTWQLIINTASNIITFLMVFLIQNTQNRDAKAIQLKLDELIRTARGVRHEMIDLNLLSDEELAELKKHFDLVIQKGRLKPGQHRKAA